MTYHSIFVTQSALHVEHSLHRTETPELSNRYITEHQYYVLSKLLQTPNATYYPNYCRPRRYVLSKLLQTSKATYYPNYCRPPMPCIIQITADLQSHVLSKLLQTPPIPCIIQITGDPQCHVLSKLLQTPNIMYYPNYSRSPMLCIIQITADPQHNVFYKLLLATH